MRTHGKVKAAWLAVAAVATLGVLRQGSATPNRRAKKRITGAIAASLAVGAFAVLATLLVPGQDQRVQANEPVPQARINENSPSGSPVGTPMQATAAGGAVRYALSGPDAASFTIDPNTGEVSLAQGTSPDFEARAEYRVTVTASADVTVQVVNVNELGMASLSTDESAIGETITASIADPDGEVSNAAWSWARSGADGWDTISGANEASYTPSAADIGHRLQATASYDDAAGPGQEVSAATANPVRNEPPQFASDSETREVPENAASGATVGTPVVATDPNGNDIAYSGSGSAHFGVDPNTGQISVAEGANLDHEAAPSHTLTITATDSHDDDAETTVTVNVVNVEEPGAVTLSHDELRADVVITAILTDPDGSVSGETWQWSRSDEPIGGATSNSYTVTADDVGHALNAAVRYDDGHGSSKSAQATTASRVGNDAPAFPSASIQRAIDENAPVGSAAGEPVAATDPNGDPLTYSLTGSDAFSVQADGTVVSSAQLDHEAATSHTVSLTATDAHGAAGHTTVTITVNNLDETGALSLSNAAPKVGDAVMATLSDPDGEPSEVAWQWQRGDGTGWTDIAAATSASYTVESADIGHLLRVNVSYADPQGPGKIASAQTGNAVANDPPTFATADPMNAAVAENAPLGAFVGQPLQATDPNDDPLNFSLSGTDADTFSVDAGGRITMTAVPDYEARSSYQVTATVSDPASGSDAITVNVAVQNVEEPGSVAFDTDASPEVNIRLTAALDDPDGSVMAEAWQWQSSGSASGPWADVSEATNAAYTPTTADVHRYLRATVSYMDGHGDNVDTASAISAFAVTPEPNRPPRFGDHTTTFNISVNVREGVRVAPPFTATDPNDDTLNYSIVSDTPDAFTINSTTGEVLMGGLEMSEDATYTASISVSDGVDGEWREDRSPDDFLDLTMTIVNPNIVIEPSSYAAFPKGLWVDDDIVVTTNESNRDWAMVYDRETQQYLEDRSFSVGGRSYPTMRGVWSDGTTLYVLAARRSRANPGGNIFAYRLSDGARRSSEDIILPSENAHPVGLTGREGVLYVGDGRDRKIYAYDIETRSRQSDHDINGIDTFKRNMTDFWLDGETIWISYWLSDFIRAYDVATGDSKPGLDVQLARENAGPSGIYSDGFNLWCMDSVNDTIYGYVLPQ